MIVLIYKYILKKFNLRPWPIVSLMLVSSIPVTFLFLGIYETTNLVVISVDAPWIVVSCFLVFLFLILSGYMVPILCSLYFGVFLGSANFLKEKLWSRIDEDVVGEFCGIRLTRIWSKSELEDLILSELKSKGIEDPVSIPDDIIDKSGALKFVGEILEEYEFEDEKEVLVEVLSTQDIVLLSVVGVFVTIFLVSVAYNKGWLSLGFLSASAGSSAGSSGGSSGESPSIPVEYEGALEIFQSMASDPDVRDRIEMYTDNLASIFGESYVKGLRSIIARADESGLAPDPGDVSPGVSSPGGSVEVSPDVSPVGSSVGSPVGSPDVSPDVSPVGSPVGSPDVSPDVSPVGSPVGGSVEVSPDVSPVGSSVGSPVGSPDVSPVGSPVGSPDVSPVGSSVGSPVGSPEVPPRNN